MKISAGTTVRYIPPKITIDTPQASGLKGTSTSKKASFLGCGYLWFSRVFYYSSFKRDLLDFSTFPAAVQKNWRLLPWMREQHWWLLHDGSGRVCWWDGKRCQVARPKEDGPVDVFYYVYIYIWWYIFRVDFDGGIFSSYPKKNPVSFLRPYWFWVVEIKIPLTLWCMLGFLFSIWGHRYRPQFLSSTFQTLIHPTKVT